VLGDRDKAKGAVADAKRALANHPDAIKQLDELAKQLSLNG
jgi:cytochrome c-type biogenesis protein CcmH